MTDDATIGPSSTGPQSPAGRDGYADLVLDGLADLKQVTLGWSPQAWQLLTANVRQDSSDPRALVERARSRALVAAIENNRMELVRCTGDELRRQIPLTLTVWEHDAAGQALDDAALAMITADQITTPDFNHLLSAWRQAAATPRL